MLNLEGCLSLDYIGETFEFRIDFSLNLELLSLVEANSSTMFTLLDYWGLDSCFAFNYCFSDERGEISCLVLTGFSLVWTVKVVVHYLGGVLVEEASLTIESEKFWDPLPLTVLSF